MNSKLTWPTLEGRMKHQLKSDKQALKQLKQSGLPLSEYGEKLLKKLERGVDKIESPDRM